MKQYIFITGEGTTFQPGSQSNTPDIENMQVIGFASGNSPQEAAKNLLAENAYLKETSFDEIKALELKSPEGTCHYLKEIN